MINPQEIRIGNLLADAETGIIGTVYKIDKLMEEIGLIIPVADYDRWDYEYKEIEPIPLTEEWLGKLGFEKEGTELGDDGNLELGDYSSNDITILWVGKEGNYTSKEDFGWVISRDQGMEKLRLQLDTIKYVHQLMNLYYSLTGQELTVK